MERITWDQFFMAQCHLLAVRSTCTRLAVGATIVRDNRIIAGGYNGSISGGDHCIDHGCYVVDNHCVRTIHAEMNALLQCAKYGSPIDGASIYVTHFPCLQCSKAIIQAGIRTVNYAKDYRNNEYAIKLFEQAGVELNHIPNDESKVDFTKDGKVELLTDILDEMKALGAPTDKLSSFKRRVDDLFGN
ncbi:ComE operon protein 2 [Sporosarcina thermotolerans]|uniref:ComE operon protein 2 n=1 Tax=Sporosarcina thermotolerans TaxID=633404 RepID=A0AAW9AB28_9BACL|nr:ComE operon protein 2 [Sporosarcina thermotolerans]MDW0117409.1 ComE operon protein 2 [Sporosarcina thermotolerans]WHT47546.1 ComE operon protein 2 [Sporosarcina thermotolerans]